MHDVDKYISEVMSKKAHSKRSKLAQYQQQILKMRTAGLTYAEIQEYLSRCGVNVTIPAIRYRCNQLLKVKTSTEKLPAEPTAPSSTVTIKKTTALTEKKSKDGWQKPEWATVNVDINKYI
ncbi:hypothetical protein V757_12830 [Pelistega indica]|uniref:Uncharacterized protein n=1 Tax=Pelistega indica TaxID=1414851 RepID=V8FQ85_9BURK|nr:MULTISPECIES: hypothetical protein [Pelistega]ETD66320.1 hypothetical protein V757_12830 [Pelistega indica]